MLHHYLSLRRGSAVDAEARWYFQAQPAANVSEIVGQLHGPHCSFARTLPTSFSVKPIARAAGDLRLSEVYVTDPCFWTPQLPFLYDLRLNVKTETGQALSFELAIGMKRWYVQGTSWYIEGKRTVLRGAQPSLGHDHLIATARQAETTLVVRHCQDTTLVAAARAGVGLLVDLSDKASLDGAQEHDEQFEQQIERLNWNPSVMAVIGDASQLKRQAMSAGTRCEQLPIGLALDAQSSEPAAMAIDCDFFAVALQPAQRPPSWLAGSPKPVIAIRHDAGYADLQTARSAADGLQAELSPEFDLAGYFVTP